MKKKTPLNTDSSVEEMIERYEQAKKKADKSFNKLIRRLIWLLLMGSAFFYAVLTAPN